MTLLEILFRYQKEIGNLSLTVLHFNHHLRGAESNRDAAFVKQEAAARGFDCLVVDLPLIKGSGIQNRARDLRRQKLQELSGQKGWSLAFLAHHADDQVETVLMHLLRGAALKGLKGMEMVCALRSNHFLGSCLRHTSSVVDSPRAVTLFLVRPLLEVTRQEITDFVRTQGISFVEDSSNGKKAYWRNQIRYDTLPEIRKYFPDLTRTIQRSCRQLQREYRLFCQEAESFLKKTEDTWTGRGNYFRLEETSRFLVLSQLIHQAGFEKEFLSRHFEEIEDLLKKEKEVKREYGRAALETSGPFFRFVSMPSLSLVNE